MDCFDYPLSDDEIDRDAWDTDNYDGDAFYERRPSQRGSTIDAVLAS